MIERIQQHHPDMGITEIVRSLNDAMNDMGFKTDIIESADQFTTTGDWLAQEIEFIN